MRRAGMALAWMQGRSVPEVAVMFAAKEETVRELIRAFNDRGFAALDPKARRGSMPRIGPAVREQICRTAKSDPARLGCPFTCWSLTKLRDYLAAHTYIGVSHETIRQVLRNAGISFQSTKTWKHSNDPDFATKKDRILALYDQPPGDGRVICLDEFGPLNLMPRPGKGWFPVGRPTRLRATYHRTAGVRHMFAALDLASGEMFYRIRDRKRAIEFEFTALRYFVLDGSDYPSHQAQQTAIARYIRWRNKQAKPKTRFAIGSKIRQPDYLPLSA